jgi:hypothetical protein
MRLIALAERSDIVLFGVVWLLIEALHHPTMSECGVPLHRLRGLSLPFLMAFRSHTSPRHFRQRYRRGRHLVHCRATITFWNITPMAIRSFLLALIGVPAKPGIWQHDDHHRHGSG